MAISSKQRAARESTGKLRIGDDWNAINIIALSQSNPLKAVAEFVENSIDAHAKQITIIRGRTGGQSYLKILDDGDGIPLGPDGTPNFKYVATHIGDSIKRQMKAQGQKGIQGEFGIGLLSFWTVGQTLSLVSSASDGAAYEMRMAKGDPTYSVSRLRRLLADAGTELMICPLLPGIRHFSGEKLQWYLASELRDRIRQSGAEIRIVDRQARAEYRVEPRAFAGQLLHHLPIPATSHGELYVELYLTEPSSEKQVGLYRSGTRVLESLTSIDCLQRPPWTTGCLEGVIDAPFLNLTPGSRTGIVHDERFAAFLESLGELEAALDDVIRQQQSAADERANRDTLKAIQRAFREALLVLPEEEYDWFEAYGVDSQRRKRLDGRHHGLPLPVTADGEPQAQSAPPGEENLQREFFEFAGPLFSVRIAPATCTMPVKTARSFRAMARDRGGRQIEQNVVCEWSIVEGIAQLANAAGEIVTLTAPDEPQLIRLAIRASQGDVAVTAEALVTVTDSLLPERPKSDSRGGLPEYTFEKRPGELWRSRFNAEQNVIVINNGHRDFVYAARNKSLKLRYVCRLFAKELVVHNFPGYTADQLLERMIELLLYTEENLR
ncbi:MAG: ATP-binding protein [Pirellulales bacterium]